MAGKGKDTHQAMPEKAEPEETANHYYWRLQQVQKNEVIPTWEFPPEDRDADSEDNFSYGKDGYERPKSRFGGVERGDVEQEQDIKPSAKPRGTSRVKGRAP